MKTNIFLVGSAFLFMFLTGCKKDNNATSAMDAGEVKEYPISTLAPQDVELQMVYPTVLKGQEDIDIKPRIDGFIEAVYIDEGSIVKKGQPLFKINSPSSVQLFQKAEADFNTAKLDIDRMRPLSEKGIISNVRLKAYENSYASSQATFNQAKEALKWTTVTSPVNGVVGTILFRLGSLVNNTTVLTSVSNTSNVIAYFSLNEKDFYEFMRNAKGTTQAEKINNIPALSLILSDGSFYEEKGRIQTISGLVDAVSGAVVFRATFPNSNGLLRSGTSGKVIIPKYLKSTLVIPQKATFSQQDKVLVFKVQGDSVVQKTISVKPTPDGKSFAVTEGLETGDRIVTDGIITLKNGQKIKI